MYWFQQLKCFRAGDLTERGGTVKCLLLKHRDLSSLPSVLIKAGVQGCMFVIPTQEKLR